MSNTSFTELQFQKRMKEIDSLRDRNKLLVKKKEIYNDYNRSLLTLTQYQYLTDLIDDKVEG